jgi:hypothetical protein
MNPLIKALKIIGFFILFFMLLNESFACKINREFYDRTEKDIFNSNEIILI